MIEVGNAAIIEWQIGEIAVVGILLDENYFTRRDRFEDAIGDSCFAGARSA